MRNIFVNKLTELAALNANIHLIVGDLGYSVVEPFSEKFPDRFINAGVAEQNMTGLAAGMASEGCHVFTYSIANFSTYRCAEQIRNDVAYHNLPVTVVSVGGGVAYGSLGYSHHAVQDYALLRTMPNVLICSPGDPLEVSAVLHYLNANPQPSYLRLGKAGEINIHQNEPHDFKPGSWLPIDVDGRDKAVVTTGAILQQIMLTDLRKEFSDHDIFSVPMWSMESKNSQSKNLARYKEVTTLENHLVDGGFGSWMMEAKLLKSDLNTVIKLRALDPTICGSVGSENYLHKIGGL